jgi:hypothetical protein
MSVVKVVVVCGLMAVLLSACGIQKKPLAGTPHLRKYANYHAIVDDPRKDHFPCLRKLAHKDHIKIRRYYTAKQKLPAVQMGTLPSGPTIVWYPTAGIAQGLQIMGQEQGAEVIGAALLYPHGTRGKLLVKVEQCTVNLSS